MKSLINKLEEVKKGYVVIAFFIGLIFTFFIGFHNVLNKYDEILDTVKTTQQMSLKSVIWNDNIPLAERTSACDVYLDAGYNSLTKKHCQLILENTSSSLVFFYEGKEDLDERNDI